MSAEDCQTFELQQVGRHTVLELIPPDKRIKRGSRRRRIMKGERGLGGIENNKIDGVEDDKKNDAT